LLSLPLLSAPYSSGWTLQPGRCGGVALMTRTFSSLSAPYSSGWTLQLDIAYTDGKAGAIFQLPIHRDGHCNMDTARLGWAFILLSAPYSSGWTLQLGI